MALYAIGKSEEALKACNKALQLNPEYQLAQDQRRLVLSTVKKHVVKIGAAERETCYKLFKL